jgi:hypothetical protein
MTKRQQWTTIEPFNDLKNKMVRIQTALHGIASNGRLFVRRSMTGFIEQWTRCPALEFDDILDWAAMGCIGLGNAFLEIDETGEDNIVPFKVRRACP